MLTSCGYICCHQRQCDADLNWPSGLLKKDKEYFKIRIMGLANVESHTLNYRQMVYNVCMWMANGEVSRMPQYPNTPDCPRASYYKRKDDINHITSDGRSADQRYSESKHLSNLLSVIGQSPSDNVPTEQQQFLENVSRQLDDLFIQYQKLKDAARNDPNAKELYDNAKSIYKNSLALALEIKNNIGKSLKKDTLEKQLDLKTYSNELVQLSNSISYTANAISSPHLSQTNGAESVKDYYEAHAPKQMNNVSAVKDLAAKIFTGDRISTTQRTRHNVSVKEKKLADNIAAGLAKISPIVIKKEFTSLKSEAPQTNLDKILNKPLDEKVKCYFERVSHSGIREKDSVGSITEIKEFDHPRLGGHTVEYTYTNSKNNTSNTITANKDSLSTSSANPQVDNLVIMLKLFQTRYPDEVPSFTLPNNSKDVMRQACEIAYKDKPELCKKIVEKIEKTRNIAEIRQEINEQNNNTKINRSSHNASRR